MADLRLQVSSLLTKVDGLLSGSSHAGPLRGGAGYYWYARLSTAKRAKITNVAGAWGRSENVESLVAAYEDPIQCKR